MTRLFLLLLCLVALLPLPAAARLTSQPESWQQDSDNGRDLAAIRGDGVLRVLVNQSRNSFGQIKGEQIGIEYNRLRAFEQYLNDGAPGRKPLTLKFIPKAKDQLLAALQRGEGDLVAPGELLSALDGQNVSASLPWRQDVPLVLVSRQGSRRYSHLEQMAGRTIALPAGSAAGDAIRQVNERLAQRRLAPLSIEWVDPSLAVEDVLEMVQAGIFAFTVVEQPIAERWAKVFPKIRVDRHLVLDNRQSMTWYVRRDAPMLHASVDRFLKEYRAPADQDGAFQRIYRHAYQVRNPLESGDRKRLEAVRPTLQRYAEQYRIDWLALAAVAFKESNLDAGAQGASGATGLMQVTPAAARSVGVGSVQQKENNVQAASKYLAMLRRDYFNSPRMDERERLAFILAAYNVGAERVQGLRAEARRRGLNPNRWFFQVERVAASELGMGVVNYVSSINKYYLAYQRERDGLEPRQRVASARK
ncbi:MltF family protein [Pseudomonas panipatensis]|uniref:Membrane-bound lytic murein transglycosylase MltF n=1 Tax=Pseudomonas panipatensis TaxID=428992 RepID=A0A1G8CM47_9PSED|nr:transglycosylase SLT domain-containing protein [Pseudomonas panipatensis]SDH46363.1 Membrane-bound lytic murein transglycosylase MltF [Pseudomonas panipatensis]SMP64316.1 Membrane-bound lytic murein transglycosylase MltF [Pseudomonas panipatensis]